MESSVRSGHGTAPDGDARRALEREIATLMVEALRLELTPEEIDPEGRLFNEGLGLDSIDALELALTISRRYGVAISSDDPRSREIFSSLRRLAAFVAEQRAQLPAG